jgi:hypothetical protein
MGGFSLRFFRLAAIFSLIALIFLSLSVLFGCFPGSITRHVFVTPCCVGILGGLVFVTVLEVFVCFLMLFGCLGMVLGSLFVMIVFHNIYFHNRGQLLCLTAHFYEIVVAASGTYTK